MHTCHTEEGQRHALRNEEVVGGGSGVEARVSVQVRIKVKVVCVCECRSRADGGGVSETHAHHAVLAGEVEPEARFTTY